MYTSYKIIFSFHHITCKEGPGPVLNYRRQTKFAKVMFLAAYLLKQSVAYLVCHVYGCM